MDRIMNINSTDLWMSERFCTVTLAAAWIITIVMLIAILIRKRRICLILLPFLAFEFLSYLQVAKGWMIVSRARMDSVAWDAGSRFFICFLLVHLGFFILLAKMLVERLVTAMERFFPVKRKPVMVMRRFLCCFLFMLFVLACYFRLVSVLFDMPLSNATLLRFSFIGSICLSGAFSMLSKQFRLQQGIFDGYKESKLSVPEFMKLQDDEMYGQESRSLGGQTIRSVKDYYALKAEDLIINGNHIWELTHGNVKQKIRQGVRFLEFFHNVRIGSDCVEEAMKCSGNRRNPCGLEYHVITRLHEACKLAARGNSVLSNYRAAEAELALIEEEGCILVPEGTALKEKGKIISMRKREIEMLMEQLEQEFPINLTVDLVRKT